MGEGQRPMIAAGEQAPRKASQGKGKAPSGSEKIALPGAARPMSKTPMFTAAHAARYQRQTLIKDIDQRAGTHLICYISSDQGDICRDDVFGFVDLLHNIPAGMPIDLMLHTLGGDVDAAEKIMILVRKRLGDSRLRVVIPSYAKSAGTLMALGAERLLMSDSSELGMIDPQFTLNDDRGNPICTSVIAYLEAWEEHSRAVRADPEDRAARVMLAQFDPVLIRKLQGQRDHTRDIAMRLINRVGGASTQISATLMDLALWKSHGQIITSGDAEQMGLPVDYVSAEDELWQMYWHLLCLQRLEVGDKKKLFESAYVSQLFDP